MRRDRGRIHFAPDSEAVYLRGPLSQPPSQAKMDRRARFARSLYSILTEERATLLAYPHLPEWKPTLFSTKCYDEERNSLQVETANAPPTPYKKNAEKI